MSYRCRAREGADKMRQEWLRHSNSADRWALFLIFEKSIDVLANISADEHIHRTMTINEARVLWNELLLRDWHRCSEDEIVANAMTMAKLQAWMYSRRG